MLDTEFLPDVGIGNVTRVRGLNAGGTLGLVMGRAGFDIKIGNGTYIDVKEELGALIEVTSQSNGMIRGGFLCTVNVVIVEAPGTGEDKEVVLGRSVKEDQIWVVS
jgi:hypothetical protein